MSILSIKHKYARPTELKLIYAALNAIKDDAFLSDSTQPRVRFECLNKNRVSWKNNADFDLEKTA